MTHAEAEERARALGHEPYRWFAMGERCWGYYCRYDGQKHELHGCPEALKPWRDRVDNQPCPSLARAGGEDVR